MLNTPPWPHGETLTKIEMFEIPPRPCGKTSTKDEMFESWPGCVEKPWSGLMGKPQLNLTEKTGLKLRCLRACPGLVKNPWLKMRCLSWTRPHRETSTLETNPTVKLEKSSFFPHLDASAMFMLRIFGKRWETFGTLVTHGTKGPLRGAEAQRWLWNKDFKAGAGFAPQKPETTTWGWWQLSMSHPLHPGCF